MPINVGPACINRGGALALNITYVTKDNPANETGVINYICLWAATVMSGIEVASFSAVGNDLTTNGHVALANAAVGKNEYNAPGDFAAFNINVDEYIGIYYTGGTIDVDWAGGVGVWDLAGDQIPCVGATFALTAGRIISLHGTGTTGAGLLAGLNVGLINYSLLRGLIR